MQRNFLPNYVGIAMMKSEFCFCTGISPYHLRRILSENPTKWKNLGYHKRDKLLMPAVIRELLAETNLQIDLDYYTQYVSGKRGVNSLAVGG